MKRATSTELTQYGILFCWIGILFWQSIHVPLFSFPDEAAHLDYIFHMADRWPSMMPDFKSSLLPTGQANYLIHPPLYYWLAGSVLRALQFMNVQLSREGLIFLFRMFSVILSSAGAFGFILLVRRLSEFRFFSSPRMATLALCLVLGTPIQTFILGGVNNDVLVWMLSPFLSLALLGFWNNPHSLASLSLTIACASLAVLAKATLWPLALLAGVFVFVGLVRHSRMKELLSSVSVRKNIGVLVFALLSFGWAGGFVLSNKLVYGHIQPKYIHVHGIAVENSVFYNAPQIEAAQTQSPSRVIKGAVRRYYETTMGLLGHGIKKYPHRAAERADAFRFVAVLLSLLGVWALLQKKWKHAPARVYFIYSTLLFAIFCFFMFRKNLSDHYLQARYGAQGRYFLGTLQLYLVGLWGAVDMGWHSSARGLRIVVAVLTILLWSLIWNPFYYFFV